MNPFTWIGDTLRMIIILNFTCVGMILLGYLVFLFFIARMIIGALQNPNLKTNLIVLFKFLVVVAFAIVFVICLLAGPPFTWIGDLADIAALLLSWRWADGQRLDANALYRSTTNFHDHIVPPPPT